MTAIQGTAGAAPDRTADSGDRSALTGVHPAMMKAMKRDLGLTTAQAERRIAGEAKARTTDRKLRKDLGADYAGSWVVGDEANLVVATTDASEVSAIRAAGARARVVDHDLRTLNRAMRQLDAAAGADNAASAPVWYVDVTGNEVVILASDTDAAADFVAASGADASLISVEVSDEQPRTFYDLVGGDAYYIGGGRCSVGFSVRQGTRPGFATAGHCGGVGASTTGFNGVSQGVFRGSVFPGGDGAWVEVNGNWTPTPFVRGSASSVAGSQQAPVGSSICRSGSTTGWHCGTIQQHGTSVSYAEGTVNNVTRTTVCAEPGDSGGSYISGNQAQGVTSGGSGNCTFGGTTYHQPINPILNTWGLTLVTN